VVGTEKDRFPGEEEGKLSIFLVLSGAMLVVNIIGHYYWLFWWPQWHL
jgi:hypothetical protein